MNAQIELLKGAAFASVQDLGRYGYQAIGLGPSGVMDFRLAFLANGLLGQKTNCAGLEFSSSPLELRALNTKVQLIIAALSTITIEGKSCPSFTVLTLEAEQILHVHPPNSHTYGFIAFAGGLACQCFGNSQSRHIRANIGSKLFDGIKLPLNSAGTCPKRTIKPPSFLRQKNPILTYTWGPQENMFTEKARLCFESQPYRVSGQRDRMGLHLEGTRLEHLKRADITSDPIAFGAIQVPANGQPIAMLAERQTTGGYAKIACLTRNSAATLAQCPTGREVRFKAIRAEDAQLQAQFVAITLKQALENVGF